MSTIIEEMIHNYTHFTKSERKIIDYILSHRNEAQYLSITDLSNACQLSVSTISVFCRKLGAEGFNVFKLELAKASIPHESFVGPETVGTITGEDTIDDVFDKTLNANKDALLKTYQMLNKEDVSKAVDLLKKARQVVCLGQGNHSIVAKAAWARFSTVSSRFKTIDDAHLQIITAATMKRNDVLLYFSYSGATHDLLELARLVKSRGAKIILITRFRNSPATVLSDLNLIVGADEQPYSYGSLVAMTSQLLLIDILYNEYCRRDFAKADELRNCVGTALAKKCL